MGSDEKVAAFVESKIFAKLIPMVERLSDFDDLQSAFFLLRVSFTIVRATHFMRTTPGTKLLDLTGLFDVLRNPFSVHRSTTRVTHKLL